MMTNDQAVQALYIGYFGRAAEPGGYQYWDYEVNHGFGIQDAAASFSVQHEATSLYPFLAGTSTDAESFVTQVYHNLFDRAPDADGLQYWVGQLNSRAGDPDAVGHFILDVINGAQTDDASVLSGKISDAQHFTDAVQQAGIETDHYVDGHVELLPDALQAAHDVVDGQGDASAETQSYIDSHSTHDVHTVYVDVPGPTIYVPTPTEPTHDLSFTLDGTLPLSSTADYGGTEMGFGSGNLPTNYAFLTDDTAGELMGFKAHFRTGDDVHGSAGSGGVDVVWNMPAGAQDGTIGNESGANDARSHASLDIVIDNGVGLPHTGEYVLKIDNDPSASVNFQNFTLTDTGGGNWAFLNQAGTDGQGMTVSNDGHVLADSFNLGFGFANMPHGATTGDVLPGQYDIELVHVVGTTEVAALHGQFDLA
jgi:hypothetical protein